MTGTNKGGLPFFNIPANGAKVETEWISFYRLLDGKVAEHRALMDVAGLMAYLKGWGPRHRLGHAR